MIKFKIFKIFKGNLVRLFKLLLPFFLLLPLYSEDSWSLKIGASIQNLSLDGSISNSVDSASIRDDFGYDRATSSNFFAELTNNRLYVPNFKLTFYNVQNNKDTVLSKNVEIAGQSYGSSISSDFKNQVLSAVLYKDLKVKGKYFKLFKKYFYTGDVQFDAGAAFKEIYWKINVNNATNTAIKSWIKVQESIVLPYLSAKYYLYNFTLYSNITALSLDRAQSYSYQYGVEYLVADKIYLTIGNTYENFRVVEKLDTVEFTTSGYTAGFKYLF